MPRIAEATPVADQSELTRKAVEYATVKAEADALATKVKALRDEIVALAKVEGVEDDDGHVWFDLGINVPYGVDRKGNPRTASQVMLQRSVKFGADVGAAERISEEKSIDLIDYVPVIDQQAVTAALEQGLISGDDVEEMFPRTESFALYLK